MRNGIEGATSLIEPSRGFLASAAWTGGRHRDRCRQLGHSAGLGECRGRDRSRSASPPTSPARSAMPAMPTPMSPKIVVKRINDGGGVLGRPLELLIEDTASNESVAVANVRKLIQRDKVDVVLGGITSSMRNAIKDVIVDARQDTLHLSAALRGQGVHALSLLHRTDAGATMRRIHSLADQERRQALRVALGQLCLAASAQRLCAQA